MAGSSKQIDGSALDCFGIQLGFRLKVFTVECMKIDHRRRGLIYMDLKLDLEQFLKDVDIGDETEFVGCENDRSNHCCVGEKHGVHCVLCVGIEEEKRIVKKRKKECYLPLLDWLKTVAKNPCDPATGVIPESSKWKAYGSEHVWKQILMAKETMCLKDNVNSNAKQSIWKVILDSSRVQ
ncbi:hypothetical protein E3N88_16974 [Mikania micrantha]|uniref:Uncharacterized protein n=1 Tax=Mikania micrantha TaxID=192012 RepID=A0A5N6LDL9_9ASTR|nr:hypothetical protein E3N88_43888 [Mikania micrantha]KAD5317028.1 hypothetical protein E3N88_16974 [Mikania micrantha]